MGDSPIGTVGVIGAGTMGAGIAQVCSQIGWEVRLLMRFQEELKRAYFVSKSSGQRVYKERPIQKWLRSGG